MKKVRVLVFAATTAASVGLAAACSSSDSSSGSSSTPDAAADRASSSGSIADSSSDGTSGSVGVSDDPCFITSGTYTIHDTLVPDGGVGDAAACPVPDDRVAVATPATPIPPLDPVGGCTRTEDKATCTFTSECVTEIGGTKYFETLVMTTAGGVITVSDHTTKIENGSTTADYDCQLRATYTPTGAPTDAGDASDASDATDAADAGDTTDASDASDATDAADAGDTTDAGVVDPDAGAPTGPTILLADTTLNRIDLLTTTGTLIRSYPSPVANVTGVSHDRRARDGFWLMGKDDATKVYKRAWTGAALPSVTNVTPTFVGSNVRGLDHWVSPDGGASADLLAFVETVPGSSIDGMTGISPADGSGKVSMGFYRNGGFQSGLWGVSMVDYSSAANVTRGWFSHDQATPALERWNTGAYETGVTIAIAHPRGVARTSTGEFWVVDPTAAKVVHLDATGVVLGSFSTPGANPAGVSFDPGP